MDGFNQYFSLPAIKPRSWQVQPSANNEKPKVMATKSASNCLSGSWLLAACSCSCQVGDGGGQLPVAKRL